MAWQRWCFSRKTAKEICTIQNALLVDIKDKCKKAQITILLNISCAVFFSPCLFDQTLPLKSLRYGDCMVLLSITPTTVLQGSANKQIDSDTAWPADHGSFINTTTLTANPGEGAASLPPPRRPQGPSNIRWEASSYSSRGSICNKRHPFSRPAVERLGTSHSSPSH